MFFLFFYLFLHHEKFIQHNWGMKRKVLVLLSTCVSLATEAQVIQSGIVKEYNEELAKTPLANVEVLVSDAGQKVSNKDGSFELRFRTKRLGDHVSVTRIEKLGYEVFNKEAVEQWNISGKEHPFVIVMCNSEKFKRIRDNYERISSESYARQQQKERKKIEAERAVGKIKEEEYQAKILQLQDEFDRQKESVQPYIERFARIDLSEVSEQEHQIIKTIQLGDIDKGIEMYKQLNPEEIFKNNRELKKNLDVSTDSAFAMICRKNDALLMQGGRDNLRLVEESLRSVAECDTTYLYALSAYSTFLFQRGRDQENLRYLFLINKCGEKDFPHYLSSMYHSTGYAFKELGKMTEAEHYFQKSREANERYNRTDTLIYLDNLSVYLGDMADVLKFRGDVEKEGKMREREYTLGDSLCSLNPKKYGVQLMGTLLNLTQYYINHKPEKVPQALDRLQALRQMNIYENQDDQSGHEAFFLFMTAQYARSKGDTLYTESLFRQAEALLKPLYAKDRQRYNMMYGPILALLGVQFYERGLKVDAQAYLEKALPICEEVLVQNPRSILTSLVVAQLIQGRIKMGYGYLEEADSLFREAYQNSLKIEVLHLSESPIVVETEKYLDVMDFENGSKYMSLESLAKVSLALGRDDEAEKYLTMQIELGKQLEDKYGEDTSVGGMWYAFYNLGMLCLKQKSYDRAEKCFLQCCIFTEDGVTDARDLYNAEHMLIELYDMNGRYDKCLKMVDMLLKDAKGEKRLGLLHAKGVCLLKKGETKKAKKIWELLKIHDLSGLPKNSLLIQAFGK